MMARTHTALALGYEEAGTSERTPLVFLHGVGSDKSVWRPQLQHFAAERRTLAFDYPGYGDSDPAHEGTSRDDYAAAILAALDSLGVQRAHVCGLSLGGVVAIAVHAAAPDRIVSLILADTFAAHPDGQAIYERSIAASSDLRVLAEARVDVLLGQPADPEIRREVIETRSAISPAAYCIGAEAVWLADQRTRVHDIRVPTLVLCGTEDKVTPPALSRELVQLIPGARLEMIDGAGHLGNLEKPDAFNTVVGAFVRAVDSHA
jgi:3-oxoadipate enol-lactonase